MRRGTLRRLLVARWRRSSSAPLPNTRLQLSGPQLVFYTDLVPSGRRTRLPWAGLGGRVPAAEAQVRWAPGRGRAVALRIWLHEGHDGDPGVLALGLELLGFSTWADSKAEVLAKVPAKFSEYSAWRSRHGAPVSLSDSRVEIVGHAVGNEILFPPDLEAALAEDIDLAIHLLASSRADLLAQLREVPEPVLDWDPPYRRFAPWADWRTIRANLAHIANAETHYYTRNIGHQPSVPQADPKGEWRAFLPASRAMAVAFLETVKSSRDLRRVGTVNHGFGEESWSVRKALRRLVSHELLHSKSIARIIRAHAAVNGRGHR